MRFPIIGTLCLTSLLSILDIRFVNAKGSKGRPWSPSTVAPIVTTPNTPVITPSFFPPVPVADTSSIAPAVISPNTPVKAPSFFPPAPVADTPSIAPAVISPNTPVNAPSNFPPAPVADTPSVALVSPVNIPQPSLCEINPAKNLVTVLSVTSDKFKACGENIEEVKNTIERVNEALNTVRNIATLLNETVQDVDDVERMMQSMSVFTDMIPKIGKLIRRMRQTIKKLQKTFEKGLKPIEGNLAKMDAAFQNVTSNLEKVETITKSGGEQIEMIRKPLNTAVSCIERNQCFLEEPMAAIADAVPTEPFEEVVQPLLDVCSLVFGDLNKINVPIIDLSDFDPIHDIQGVIWGMRDFVSSVVGGISKEANKELCCNDWLVPVKFVVDKAVDLVDLAKCWIPVKSAVGASVEELLKEVLSSLNPFASGLFTAFENFNTLLSAIENAQVSDVNITFSFDLAVDEITCELDVTGNIGVEAELSNATNLGSLVDVENIDFDGQDFSLTDLSLEILSECTDAAKEVFEIEMECCDVARTCDPTHRIVLYEDIDCKDNIAGTLPLPAEGATLIKFPDDQVCLANDEASSMMLIGPLPKGLKIEIGDDTSEFCGSDYAAIKLELDLLPDEKLCIPKFRTPKFVEWDERYTIRSYAREELEEEISRFEITNPIASDRDLPLVPRCRNPPIEFFEGNDCLEDALGGPALPPFGEDIQGCDIIENNEARSVKLTGPIPKGFSIRVADDCGDFCGEDYAAIILKRDLGENEEFCIGSFMVNESYELYEIKFWGDDDLNGDVSYMHITNTGSADWPNC